MFFRRGQYGAPFELLIAVILMGFVLAVGYSAIKDLTDKACIQENQKAINGFKDALENSWGGNEKYSLSLKPCGNSNSKRQVLTFRTETNPNICRSVCTESDNICSVLQLNDPAIQACVRIPPTTTFPGPGSGTTDCFLSKGYQLVDIKDPDVGIQPGLYNFTPVPAPSAQYSSSVICVQRACSGSAANCN